ncbi:tryptophan synthase subunit alpha [Lentisphaera profundi]|uniref:Tryptophan synthase alpha chain n=1 Tax=Lentisphaera profundi TaxID=1658616 RepID=A0ABY7VYR2_9BACT|nr:tryptophan synthase subunit alpha [Lentisphaera profundi]WDE98408.1 tryptophan synthase subunit alpha [Lentisphaera profundi]
MSNQLETFCRETSQKKELMLMTHIVCGYPSFEANWRMLELMDEHGADIVELQFPFSEPSADGPLFVKANQAAVKAGVTVKDCLEFMKKASSRFSFKILMMGYVNTAWKMGYEKFTDALVEAGACGFILPDLPVEECAEIHAIAETKGLAPIMLMTPTTPTERLHKIAASATGLIYVVARKGVTGTKTQMSTDLDVFLGRCREATDLPLAVGFGVSSKEDTDYLTGKADMAIVGTASLRAWENGGEQELGTFLKNLK